MNRCHPLYPYVVADRPPIEKLAEGVEPTTSGLQNRCSTTELREQNPSRTSRYHNNTPEPRAAVKAKKPAKPYPDFPLFLHQTGPWAKKVRGGMHYFGTEPDAAPAKYLDQRDDRRAGRTPRTRGDELTVRELVNRFLTSKKALLDSDELSPRTWRDYYATGETLIDAFGKPRLVSDLAGDDFEKLRAALAKTRGPVTLGNEIQRVRTVFAFAWNENLIEKPMRFGASFKKPEYGMSRAGPKPGAARRIRSCFTPTACGSPRPTPPDGSSFGTRRWDRRGEWSSASSTGRRSEPRSRRTATASPSPR